MNAPTGVTVAPSTTTAGAITASFTAPSGTAPISYTATVCTDAGMSTNCTTQPGYVSGAQITGLIGGTNYYVTVTANPPTGYVAATSTFAGPQPATSQLLPSTNVTLGNGTTTGSISVTFTAPLNAPGSQTYTALACTDAGMSAICTTQTSYVSGAQITGLSPGTNYYVTVTAVASTGYLASVSSPVAGPQIAAP